MICPHCLSALSLSALPVGALPVGSTACWKHCCEHCLLRALPCVFLVDDGIVVGQVMSQDRHRPFEISYISEETLSPVESVSAVLARVRSLPRWDGGSVTPVDRQFPCLWIEWHASLGFVIQCYEDEGSLSDFLVSGSSCGVPSVEVELGGQALELWPSELFVSDELAEQALAAFVATGRQKPDLNWVRIDAFPRTILWEGRAGREAWERANKKKD